MSNGDSASSTAKQYKSGGCVLLSCFLVFFFALPALDTIKNPKSRAYWEGQVDKVLEISPQPSQAVVANAPAFALPSPQAPSPEAQANAPVDNGGGAPTGGGGGGGGVPACTPMASQYLMSNAGQPSWVTNGNGGTGNVNSINSTTATISMSGMKSCGLHHTMRVNANWVAPSGANGSASPCNPSLGSSVSIKLDTSNPLQIKPPVPAGAYWTSAGVSIAYDQGCP